MSKVTLLCRGESLGSINLLPRTKHSVVVNAFHFELEDENVHNYVSKCSSVTHVVSAGAVQHTSQMRHNNLYEKYNFKNIVLPYVEEVAPPIPVEFKNIRGSHGILPVTYLSDKNKSDMVKTTRYKYTSPSSGMDALLYTVNDLQADTVTIIGLDFYDNTGYFTNSYGIRRGENDVGSVMDRMKGSDHDTNNMKPFFYNFIKNHPETNFILYTTSLIDLQFDNLKVKRVLIKND